MQYEVPQFIEIEDKIIGPLTLKQFIYVAGGAALCFLIYKLLPIYIALIIIAPLGAFSAALAFYKPDGHRPFIFLVEQAFKYVTGSKLYIWKKRTKKTETKGAGEEAKDIATSLLVPKLSDSKLKELSWSLDIHENVQSRKTTSDSRI
jgi:hypothetical protein